MSETGHAVKMGPGEGPAPPVARGMGKGAPMNVEEYRKGEATLVAHCPARAYCPLGRVCATVAPGGSAPLFPVVSEVRQGELVWLDLRYEQRALDTGQVCSFSVRALCQPFAEAWHLDARPAEQKDYLL